MSFLGNTKGFSDSKTFRKNVLQLSNQRLGVIVKTLSTNSSDLAIPLKDSAETISIGQVFTTTDSQNNITLAISVYQSGSVDPGYLLSCKIFNTINGFPDTEIFKAFETYDASRITRSLDGQWIYFNFSNLSLSPSTLYSWTIESDYPVNELNYIEVLKTKTSFSDEYIKFDGSIWSVVPEKNDYGILEILDPDYSVDENGTHTSKNKGLLGLLDSNYKSDVPSTKYGMNLKAIAFESARYICSGVEDNDDQIFLNTRGEFLYQNIGSFLFPGEQVPLTSGTDVSVRNFYLSIIEAYFGGATKANIEKALYKITGIPIILRENFELSKTSVSIDSVAKQFTFDITLDTSDPRIKDINKLKSDITFILDLVKPAHTFYRANFLYYDNLESGSKIQENFNIDYFDYGYEDLRKKDNSTHTFEIDGEIVQGNGISQSSPRIVNDNPSIAYDPSIFHLKHLPIGRADGYLATQVTDISVLVNNNPVTVVAIYPLSGAFKLSYVPSETDVISVTYFYLRKYVNSLTTNTYGSLLNNLGNPYQTVTFPNNYTSHENIQQLLTNYKYRGYDLFNTSVLNDPLNLNFNDVGVRNRLNDYHVFKSFGYDFDQYSPDFQEDASLVPISLDKKDFWRRLPKQEIVLNNNEFIMNNTEDKMFGEVHQESFHPFYSALELENKDNGGVKGIVSSLFENPNFALDLTLNHMLEDFPHLGREYECSFYSYPYMYTPSLTPGSSGGPYCTIQGGAHWVFDEVHSVRPQTNSSGYFGGDYSTFHTLLNDFLNEGGIHPISDSDTITSQIISDPIPQPFTLNEGLSYDDPAVSQLTRIYPVDIYEEAGWLKFLAPKKVISFGIIYNETESSYFDLGTPEVDSFILNNRLILIRSTPYNLSLFNQTDVIKSDMILYDTMNGTAELVFIANEREYIFYTDRDITSVSSLVNYTTSSGGVAYNLDGSYILENSVIFLDRSKNLVFPLNKGDVVFAVFVTKVEENSPSATLTYPRNTRVINYLGINPV